MNKCLEELNGLKEQEKDKDADLGRAREQGSQLTSKLRDLRRDIENAWNINPLYIENAEKYLNIAKEDCEKEPEERRVLDVTGYFSELDYLHIPAKEVRDHEIFRWVFRDYADKHIKQYIPEDSRDRTFVFGSSKFRDRHLSPNVRQIWFSPSENEVLASRNDKFLQIGRILGTNKRTSNRKR